jgi:hypothetical protein
MDGAVSKQHFLLGATLLPAKVRHRIAGAGAPQEPVSLKLVGGAVVGALLGRYRVIAPNPRSVPFRPITIFCTTIFSLSRARHRAAGSERVPPFVSPAAAEKQDKDAGENACSTTKDQQLQEPFITITRDEFVLLQVGKRDGGVLALGNKF